MDWKPTFVIVSNRCGGAAEKLKKKPCAQESTLILQFSMDIQINFRKWVDFKIAVAWNGDVLLSKNDLFDGDRAVLNF